MMGALSLALRGRPGLSAAALVALCVGLGVAIGPAAADKVGVAAAVNPDAFSSLAGAPQSQINIGKSIFYNERINTTGSGLVQVLLVDGSTFTVGPGSNLVIDKFVYDPKKGTGQIAASFSKGVMRFVGGKISKNEGGVTVGTPAGALAIRGGIAYADFKSPKNFSVLFVFGDYIKLQGQTVWQPGYGLFSNNGVVTNRPFNATDLAGIMAALTNSNTTGLANNSNNGPKPTTLLNTQSLNQLISDANATQIQDQVDEELANQKSGQATTFPGGYAAATFLGSDPNEPAGTLSNLSPDQVALLFNGPGGTFSGGQFTLFVDGGAVEYVDNVPVGKGGATIVFSPIDLQTALEGFPQGLPQQLADLGLFVGGAAGEDAITVYDNTEPGPPPVLTGEEQLNEGLAVLVGVSGHGQVFCESCSFLKWGAWFAGLNFQKDSESIPTEVQAAGWFVSGDLPTIGQLPTQGNAYYAGQAFGTAAIQTCEGPQAFAASGDVNMNWNFGSRSGTLNINNFVDPGHQLPVVNMSGTMDMPGQLSAINKFSGQLDGTLGIESTQSVTGNAVGSFAANGNDKAAGVIGNFNVHNNNYVASGIFGAGHATLPLLDTNNLGHGN